MITEFKAKVIEKENITEEVILLTLKVPGSFKYQAGQYLMFKFNQDGSEVKSRAYSILSAKNENGKLKFIIRLISGGFASEIFRKSKIGDVFTVQGPLGHFIFSKDDNQEHWFIGCGCGVAPLYSMVKENLSKFTNKKLVLLFSVKTKKDLFFYDELKLLEKKYSNFSYLPTLTQEEWKGLKGRVQKHLPAEVKNKTFYICGMNELVSDVKGLLLSKGVNKENIKFERYS